MKIILCAILLSIGVYASSEYPNFQKKEYTQKGENADAFKVYTISGTFVLGSLTYSYTLVFDATICVICNPPRITINSVQSLTLCLQGNPPICATWGVSNVEHDQQNNLRHIEFYVNDIQNEDEIERYVNGEDFQQEIKDKLLNY